ncbi:tol-pal system YbgF family protein [Candidatus Margulisiibacteriota bacterium]
MVKTTILTTVKTILLLMIFIIGSIGCKYFLDHADSAQQLGSPTVPPPNTALTRLAFLNKSIAASQYYQFRMMTYYTTLDLPHVHEHSDDHHEEHHNCKYAHMDPHEALRLRHHIIEHIEEHFDIDHFYRLMELSLAHDPDNHFVRRLGTHLALNHHMMQKAADVLAATHEKHPRWRLAFETGWIYFYYLKDYDQARHWLQEAMRFEDAPDAPHNLYQATLILDRRYDMAILDTMQQLTNTHDHQMKTVLQERLHWFRTLAFLAKQASAYQRRFGKPVQELTDLVRAGLIRRIPHDPIGNGFYWNAHRQEPASRNNPFEVLNQENTFDEHKFHK